MRKLLIIGALVAPLALGAGFAQSPATPSSPKPAATEARKARADECTKQADAKKLHGAERRKFRASCKKELSKKS